MAVKVYEALEDCGERSTSRNGPVLKFPGPVTTIYTNPWHRANFTPGRDANPFFHIAEAMWMLAGRRDVAFLDYFNSNMKFFSDDGEVFNAAYGYRARHQFGHDQLAQIPYLLESTPDSRQAIIQLWDSNDLLAQTKDKACNMLMVFEIKGMELYLTVYNRSNDLIYGGVTGANPVHFSYFQQWVADRLGLPMGHLTFVSTNSHIYTDLPIWQDMLFSEPVKIRALELPLGRLEEIELLCDIIDEENIIDVKFESLHLDRIVKPIMNTWIARKQKHHPNEIAAHISECQCPALKLACTLWMERR